MTSSAEPKVFDVIVVGAGAAGIGVSVALQDAGIENFMILERFTVGAAFALWPEETRFITPSFPTNSIGMLDLNSVAIGVSPAFGLEVEHPTGKEYAFHLNAIAAFRELPIQSNTTVLRVTKVGDIFLIDTEEETIRAKHVIWAAGEFLYPTTGGFPGIELCRHTATVRRYAELDGDDFVIIGGYESGIDAAFHLSHQGKRCRILDKASPWESGGSDPSIVLSTYSFERMRTLVFKERVELMPNAAVNSVAQDGEGFSVHTADGQKLHTPVPPLFAGGFDGSLKLVSDLFEQREDGYPLLSDQDESTVVPGLFLCGPAVRHEDHIFCFIYKYRQRFAVVAKAIATSMGLPAEALETYRQWGMYLDDLSCCGGDCFC